MRDEEERSGVAAAGRSEQFYLPARPNVVLVVAYDGTDYFGWQKTNFGPSIEASLEGAVHQILQEKVTLQAASRTDRGVHALGQVVNFHCERNIQDFDKFLIGVNAFLPKDIVVLSAKKAERDFHPTLEAASKVYSYEISNSRFQIPCKRFYSWHVHVPLDLEQMKLAAKHLEGTHDFKSFCNAKINEEYEHYVRTVSQIQVLREEDRILIEVRGIHFLYRMVRNIVGTLVYAGCGKILVEDIPEILKKKDRKAAGVTAPAHGLTLVKINY
jgi:tRNA pseudouridine38-40 synthase